jgi:glycosyltransferase involved in cell wall biosynthesis
MPPFTALLHTSNDALRLGRALEMLLPCSEILIVDHGSTDRTWRIACEYGARVIEAHREDTGHFARLARHDWLLCMEPGESINESMQASLYEWSGRRTNDIASEAYAVRVREQNCGDAWVELSKPEVRLVPRGWALWAGRLPAGAAPAITLEGRLLRFVLP